MDKTERLYCRVKPEEKARLDRVAEVTGDRVSTILRNYINRAAKRHGVYNEPEEEK